MLIFISLTYSLTSKSYPCLSKGYKSEKRCRRTFSLWIKWIGITAQSFDVLGVCMWFIRVDGFGIPNFKTIFVKFVLFDICVCLRALRWIGYVIERLWRLRQRKGAHQSDVLCACLPIIVRPQTIQTKSNIDGKWSARFFGRNWNHIESHLSGPNLPSPTDWSLTTFAYVSMIMLEKFQ